MDKQKHLAQVLKIMRRRGLTMEEVAAYVAKHRKPQKASFVMFDLLCPVDGKLTRLPFLKGVKNNPVGIFPFADDNTYLELDEEPDALREDVDEERLPKHDWCRKVYGIKHQLNTCLLKLGKPILSGSYFARMEYYMPKCNWIIGDGPYGMSGTYYGADKHAKVRYIGTL